MRLVISGPPGDRPLLLLHGGGVGGWMWDPLKLHLGDGIRTLTPDLPGHDRSADQPYRSHDEAIEQLVQLLEAQERPAAVAGFSLGAQLAVLLAARRPDLVDRVCTISAQTVPMRAPGMILGLLGASAPLARQEWFARLQARELFVPDHLIDDYLRTSSLVSRETLLNAIGENIRFTPPVEWSAFPGHVLVLVGANEKRLMRRSAQRLQHLRSASALEVVSGCGHGIPLQRPRWLARRIERWLAEPPEDSARGHGG